MNQAFTGLAGMSIVMDDAAVVRHDRGGSSLALVLREMTLLANCGAVVTAALGCFGVMFPSAVSRVLGREPCVEIVVGILFEASVGGAMLTARL